MLGQLVDVGGELVDEVVVVRLVGGGGQLFLFVVVASVISDSMSAGISGGLVVEGLQGAGDVGGVWRGVGGVLEDV